MEVCLTESEVKVALREYIERNGSIFKGINPWGMMSMKANGERVEKVTLKFTQTPEDYDNDK